MDLNFFTWLKYIFLLTLYTALHTVALLMYQDPCLPLKTGDMLTAVYCRYTLTMHKCYTTLLKNVHSIPLK